MKNIFKCTTLIIALLFIAGLTMVWAENDTRRPPVGPPMGSPMDFIRVLELTPDQIDQLAELKDQAESKQIEIRSKQMQLRIELRAEMRNGDPNRTKIEAIVTQMADVHKEMMLLQVQRLFDLRSILTPAQLEKFNQMEMSRMFLHDGPRHRGPHDGERRMGNNNRRGQDNQGCDNNQRRGGGPGPRR